jgi:PleD family two-component response regulator
MMQPLALVLYEKLLPGSQVVNRLQDLNYRVQTVAEPAILLDTAQKLKPLLVLVDLVSTRNNICAAIAGLKQNPATSHLPVIAFGIEHGKDLQPLALAAGATLLVSDTAILHHLAECLDRALQID